MFLLCAHPTATKPLTPSHVKGMLWFDLLANATKLVSPVTLLANRITCDATAQNLGFWSYLDAHVSRDPGFYADKDDLWIGSRYVEYHASTGRPDPEIIDTLRRRVEEQRWMHPAGRRVLDLWNEQCAVLGLEARRSLGSWTPLELTVEDCLEALRQLDVLLDTRELGGCAYLDLTVHGLHLRQIVDDDGIPNYIVHVLRELLPVAQRGDPVVLGFDSDSWSDFDMIARVLRRAGAQVLTVALDRVQLPGVRGTTRAGGWEAYALPRLIERFVPVYGVDAFRLGVRMYFIMHVGRRSRLPVTFDPAVLDKFLRKAHRIAETLGDCAGDPTGMQGWLTETWTAVADRDRVFAEPNRLLPALIGQARQSPAARAILRELVLGQRPAVVTA